VQCIGTAIPVTVDWLGIDDARLVSVARLDDIDVSADACPPRPGGSERASLPSFTGIDDPLAAALFTHGIASHSVVASRRKPFAHSLESF
jgi:hypothetical protein